MAIHVSVLIRTNNNPPPSSLPTLPNKDSQKTRKEETNPISLPKQTGLNLLATSCGFGVVDPNDYYGLGWKKAKRSPQDDSSAPTATPDASILPVGATATPDAAAPAATPAADGTSESDGAAVAGSDDTSSTPPPALVQKGYDGSSSGGWAYPGGYGPGGVPVPAAVPVGGVSPAPAGGSSNVVPVSGGGGSSSGGGLGGAGSQPVFFAAAPPRASAGGLGGLAAAGSVVLVFGRALF